MNIALFIIRLCFENFSFFCVNLFKSHDIRKHVFKVQSMLENLLHVLGGRNAIYIVSKYKKNEKMDLK